jgi:hypothetical protein
MVPLQVETERPGSEPYLPAGHRLQVAEAVLVEYEPAGQFVQSPIATLPDTEIFPAAQLAQTAARVRSDEVALATAYFPAGQVIGPVQVATWRPVDEPYVPAGQGEQVATLPRE